MVGRERREPGVRVRVRVIVRVSEGFVARERREPGARHVRAVVSAAEHERGLARRAVARRREEPGRRRDDA